MVVRSQSRHMLHDPKLRIHLLDLRGLLFELRCENFHSLLLLGDRRSQFFDFGR